MEICTVSGRSRMMGTSGRLRQSRGFSVSISEKILLVNLRYEN